MIWPPNQQEARLEYVNVAQGAPYHRVIVNRQEQTLSRKVLGELRLLNPRARTLESPDNLQYINVLSTAEVQASKIWSNSVHQYESFGDALNMQPIVTSVLSPTKNDHTGPVKDSADDKILSWTNNVVLSANPNVAPEAPPTEPAAAPRYRVIEDSDSEDDEPPVKQSKKPPPSASEATKPSSVTQLSNHHILNGVARPEADAETVPSVLPGNDNNTLIEIADDDKVLGESVSEGPQPPSITVEDSTWMTAAVNSSDGGPTKGHVVHNKADSPDLMANLLPSSSKVPIDTQTLISGLAEATSEPESQAPHADMKPIAPPLANPRPSFNLNAYRSSSSAARGRGGRAGAQSYGHGEQTSKRNRNRDRGDYGGVNGQGNKHVTEVPSKATPKPASARNGHQGTQTGPSVHTRGGPSRGHVTRNHALPFDNRSLIDLRDSTKPQTAPVKPPGFESIEPLSPENTSHAPAIPPGFEFAVPQMPTAASHHEFNEPQSPGFSTVSSHKPPRTRPKSNATSGSSTSGRSRSSRWRFRDEGSNFVQTFIPKVDQANIRDKTLQALEADLAARKVTERIAEEDEPPVLHSTMRQQGKNPGKSSSKGSSTKETSAEAAARRQRVKDEIYGKAPVATPPHSRPSSPKVEEMSKWKRSQLRKQTPIAEAYPEIVGDSLRSKEAAKFVSLLQPIFETGRALKGHLSFEIQVGQVLVAPGQQVREKPLHSLDDWNSYFDSRGSSHTFSTFTRILTSNGADIDRALEARSGNLKLWETTPSSQSIQYEFQCQGRSNEDFQILVDEQGGHEILKGQINVGTVNIHVPAQIWDLSASMSAPFQWSDPPETVAQSVDAFCKSLYVMPKRKKLALYFRPPNDREIKIRNLIVKRISYHPCNRSDGKEMSLKVTEARNVQFRVHSQDKSLWMAYEPSFREKGDYVPQLADTGRIHYELSIVHSGINAVLVKNRDLQIGELTDPISTGKALLDRTVIRTMLDVGIQLVSKIDYVGMYNYGTQRRLEEEEQARKAKLLADLGPRARTLHGPGPSVIRESAVAGSIMGRTATATTMIQPIPGVRMNTIAEIAVDDSGNRYYLGMGGAKIPIAGGEEPPNSGATVVPDDSASQAGRAPQFATGQPSARGQGFW